MIDEELKLDQSVVPIPNNVPYVTAVVIMMCFGVLAIVLIWILRPNAMDNMLITAAVFTFIGPTTLSLLAFMKAQETHLSVNSRLDAFMKNAVKAAHAEGALEGRKDARSDFLLEEKGRTQSE